jgi:hypothetical protein
MDTKGWRGVPIAVLRQYLAGQPTHSHKMVVNEQGEVVETTQVDGQPPTVIPTPSEE